MHVYVCVCQGRDSTEWLTLSAGSSTAGGRGRQRQAEDRSLSDSMVCLTLSGIGRSRELHPTGATRHHTKRGGSPSRQAHHAGSASCTATVTTQVQGHSQDWTESIPCLRPVSCFIVVRLSEACVHPYMCTCLTECVCVCVRASMYILVWHLHALINK